MINGKTVVYTAGTFDMLHVNHLKVIEHASLLGDMLIVGVNTDEVVATYKSKPLIPFEQRLELVKALKWPDIVIPQRTLDYSKLAKTLHFDVVVVGDDWAGKFDYLNDLGIEVVYFPRGEGVSSSELKRQIYDEYNKIIEKTDYHIPDSAVDRSNNES